jgi:hypothetical protein
MREERFKTILEYLRFKLFKIIRLEISHFIKIRSKKCLVSDKYPAQILFLINLYHLFSISFLSSSKTAFKRFKTLNLTSVWLISSCYAESGKYWIQRIQALVTNFSESTLGTFF